MSTQADDAKLPTRLVCSRYHIHPRTLSRWERDPDLKFPAALVINQRKYYSAAELEEWDRGNARRVAAEAA